MFLCMCRVCAQRVSECACVRAEERERGAKGR
jgi:hypothetical protein